jgi:hypothetical protein
MDFLYTRSAPNYILAKSFPIGFAEKPGFNFDGEARMLPILEHVRPILIYQVPNTVKIEALSKGLWGVIFIKDRERSTW